MSQATRLNLKHGNLRRIARDGRRHGACAFRPHLECTATLERICAMQKPFFVTEPDEVQQRVYRLAFTEGWKAALVASEKQT